MPQSLPPGKLPQIAVCPQPDAFRVSVIIATLNRPVQLQECLQALAVGFPEDSEVIVVSDGGDKTRFPDLSRLVNPLNLKLIHVEHGGPAHARNQALRLVNSPIVVFLDDDCLPHTDWLENLISSVSLDPAVAAGGKTLNGLPENVFATAAQLILDVGERDQRERNYGPLFFSSNNLAFPTAALKALNGFNPEFRTAEDREICRKWLMAGNRLVKAPEAVLSHLPQLDYRRFWTKFMAYGRGAAKFHRSSASNWRDESIAFHLRVPVLASREMSDQGIKRRFSMYALLAVWELANLTGFLKEKWRNRKPGMRSQVSGKSLP